MFNYPETIEYLYSLLPMFQKQGKKAYKANLDNIQSLCNYLEHPEKDFPSIHVGGTNGKGSSSHLIASILQSAGYKVGLHTSPHLNDFRERIKINGEMIEEDYVADFVYYHQAYIELLKPSFFEISVAMAFKAFSEEKVDIAVIEVGLGGRLDSTNIIEPELSLITNVSWDHKDILGDTLAKIAREKAGIIKDNTPVVISERDADYDFVFQECSQNRNAPLSFASEKWTLETHSDFPNQRNVYFQEEVFLEGLCPALLGRHQEANIKGVLELIRVLSQNQAWTISKSAIQTGIEQVLSLTHLKGRWQILAQEPFTVCDVGHNEAGIKMSLELIRKQEYEDLYLVLGFARDKEVEHLLGFFPKNAHFYFCTFDSPRASSLDELSIIAQRRSLKAEFYANVDLALTQARKKAKKKDLIFIGGSTFVVANLSIS